MDIHWKKPGKKKIVRPINEVVNVGRYRECEEGEEISVNTGAGDMNMNAVDDGLKQKKWQFLIVV